MNPCHCLVGRVDAAAVRVAADIRYGWYVGGLSCKIGCNRATQPTMPLRGHRRRESHSHEQADLDKI